jgi:hypothetical protein
MEDTLTFIIPVRHPANTKNATQAKAILAETVHSISAQKASGWSGVIVANHGTDLPDLPPNFEVCYVDFPPNPLHDQGHADEETWREFFRIDRGRRMLAGLIHASNSSYIMMVDDDDLVSQHLTGHVLNHQGDYGWYFEKGYLWETNGSLIFPYSNFFKFCGTSHIVRRDLYNLPDSFESASEEYIKKMLGSHIFIDEFLRDSGTPLAPLPFPGAIYRIGHAGAHSRSSGLLHKVFGNRSLFRNPLRLIKVISQFRLVTKRFKVEFFGA